MPKLGVNIDHVATVRQARLTVEPDPVWAAALAQLGGADCITVHLREDRRHIQDRDVRLLAETVTVKLNLEMAAADEIIRIAREIVPTQATLVPEKRLELTTEGGLDVAGNLPKITDAVAALREKGIIVSLFVDAESAQIEASRAAGADAVELHTGRYANAAGTEADKRLGELAEGCELAGKIGLVVHAGHGLTYGNVRPAALIEGFDEFNIGHSIISRAIFVGIEQAVREMKRLVDV
ncbi:MAG: pyridoxine 5'-phosphate synthase [Planctomycetes bacterium]|nr:pyridoxine 5'-phosphate synthase [Planctomycetota bacterium]